MNANSGNSRNAQGRGHAAALVALAALAVIAVAWFWSTRQPAQEAGLAPQGVMVIGAGAFCAAVVAQIRAMSFMDVVDMIGELAAGFFGLVWAMLKGIGSFILGIFGWD